MASTAVPGCATQGETQVELLENPHEAIEGCLSVDIAPASAGAMLTATPLADESEGRS